MLRVLVAASLLALCAPVRAADNRPAAKDAYEAGRRHYDLGEYPEALVEFKKAYLSYAEPVFLFNIALCYRQLGDNKAAVRSYRAFLDNYPKAPNRAAVERMIEQLEAAESAKPESATPGPRVAANPPPSPSAGATTTKSNPPVASTTRPPASAATAPPPKSNPAVASATPAPRPTVHQEAPPPATITPKPTRVSRPDVTEMEEITPNFEQRSGSGPKKKVKPWVWAVTGVSIGAVVAAAVALVVVETRNTTKTVATTFTPTLPDFTPTARIVTVRF